MRYQQFSELDRISHGADVVGQSVPLLRTKFGERAFSHAGPATWNALPDHVRTVADPVKFIDEVEDEHSPKRDLLAPTDWTVSVRYAGLRP